jgi:hypothetical protein
MSQILIIEKDPILGSRLASALRQQRFQIKKHKEVLEGLRELAWFSATLIIWEPDPNDPNRLKKYKSIRQYRKYTPLMILEDSPGVLQIDPDEMLIFFKCDAPVEEIVKKTVELLGVPNFQEFEDLENEIIEENAY